MKKTTLLGIALSCFMLESSVHASAAGLRGARPNIILVMTDDQGNGDLPVSVTPFASNIFQ